MENVNANELLFAKTVQDLDDKQAAVRTEWKARKQREAAMVDLLNDRLQFLDNYDFSVMRDSDGCNEKVKIKFCSYTFWVGYDVEKDTFSYYLKGDTYYCKTIDDVIVDLAKLYQKYNPRKY